MSVTTPEGETARVKKTAKTIKTRLSELGVDIPLGHAYEVIALVNGHNNWATMSGLIEEKTKPLGVVRSADVDTWLQAMETKVIDDLYGLYRGEINRNVVLDAIENLARTGFHEIGGPIRILETSDLSAVSANGLANFSANRDATTYDVVLCTAVHIVRTHIVGHLVSYFCGHIEKHLVQAVKVASKLFNGLGVNDNLHRLVELDRVFKLALRTDDFTLLARQSEDHRVSYEETLRKLSRGLNDGARYNTGPDGKQVKEVAMLFETVLDLDVDYASQFVRRHVSTLIEEI